MKTYYLYSALSLILLSSGLYSCRQSSPREAVPLLTIDRQPAEFEEQEALWLIYPPADHLNGYSNESVVLEIIDAVLPHTRVRVAAGNDDLLRRARSRLPAEALESGRLELRKIPAVEFWTRDMGPSFVVNNEGELTVADFNFNAWGYSDTTDVETKIEEQFDEKAAEQLNLPVISTPMISEGGNREVNGRGTLMLTETVEKERNPGMTKAEMEAEFQRMLGVSTVIWLHEGLYEDDHTFRGPIELADGSKAYTVVTTNGHVDEFARFAGPNTILLAEVEEDDRQDPIGAENHRRLEENYQILKNAVDQDGNPFRIIRVPLASPILKTMRPGDYVYDYISTLQYQDGSTFPKGEPVQVIAAASYLNFIITNGVIIGQKYWQEGMDTAIRDRDEKVRRILATAFPGRQVIMLDALAVNLGGGGVHCISIHEPKINQ